MPRRRHAQGLRPRGRARRGRRPRPDAPQGLGPRGRPAPELFVVSGKQPLDGVLEKKPEEIEKSGVPPLVTRISEILTMERGRPILKAIAEAERSVALGLVKQLEAARTVMQPGGSADVEQRGRRLLGVLRERSRALETSVTGTIAGARQHMAGVAPEKSRRSATT